MNYSVYETVTKKQSFNLVSQTDFFLKYYHKFQRRGTFVPKIFKNF